MREVRRRLARVSRAGAGPLPHDGLHDRRGAHGVALQAVRDPRTGRVDPGDRANFGELPSSTQTVAAFIVAFIGSVALWWIYFDRAEEAGRRVISAASDPGRIGVSAYTYFHIPMVAGIIAAAGADELTIAHPTDEATVATTALILGGPALYLVGNAMFKWTLWDRLPRSRLVAICALAALVPLAVVSSALTLLVAAALVLVVVALWDVRAERAKSGSP